MAKSQPPQRSITTTTLPAKKQSFIQDPQILASAILGFGSAAWKILSVWSNVDFLLSIREEQFAVIFQFFQNVGWLVLIAFAVAWAIVRAISNRSARVPVSIPDWPMLMCCGVIAFIFGVLIAVKSSGGFPQTIGAYGSDYSQQCSANLLTSRLQSFFENYKIALACGFVDPSTDKLEDERITVSNPFTIAGTGLSVVAPFSSKMQAEANKLKEAAKTNPATASLWYEAILIPNDVSTTNITKLSDVIKHHGKILNPAYFK
jgi:hypothetical protein